MIDLEKGGWTALGTACAWLIIAAFAFVGYGCPHYQVWQQGLVGQAEYARADQNRKIKTLEAVAKMESAKALADAEVIRAKGVAEANKIIADGLKGHEEYLRYLWIDGLQHSTNQIVYVPTEAGLPILESTRLQRAAQEAK